MLQLVTLILTSLGIGEIIKKVKNSITPTANEEAIVQRKQQPFSLFKAASFSVLGLGLLFITFKVVMAGANAFRAVRGK